MVVAGADRGRQILAQNRAKIKQTEGTRQNGGGSRAPATSMAAAVLFRRLEWVAGRWWWHVLVRERENA